MKKVILHIGTMKTGTTSIQKTLRANEDVLERAGYRYFGPPMRNSSVLNSALRTNWVDNQNLVISDEGLWHFARTSRSDTKKFTKLLSDFDVTVLIYLRRPDLFLNSWYLQGLKSGTGAKTLTRFLASPFTEAGLRYVENIEMFSEIFGKENIRLRPYERCQLKDGDAVSDFLETTGFDVQSFKRPPQQNVTSSSDVLLLKSLFSRGIEHSDQSKKHVNVILDHLRNGGFEGRNVSLFSRTELSNLSDRFLEDFRYLQKKYGGGKSPDFFENWIEPNNGTETMDPVRLAQEFIFQNGN